MKTRTLFLNILLTVSAVTFAQEDSSKSKVHYFRANMGPKLEHYVATGNANVSAYPHMDVGAGFYLGKRFTERVYAEVGLIKNDYSARFEITSQNMAGEELKSFSKELYPTFSSVQVGLLGGYRLPLSEKWTVYGQGGVHFFLSKKLTREGNQNFKDAATNEKNTYEETMNVTTFSNAFEAGNLIFRADAGVYRRVSETLSIDISVSGRASNLPLNQFTIEYTSFSNSTPQQAEFTNKGVAINLIFGVKYRINKF
jgi:hypothetical protein